MSDAKNETKTKKPKKILLALIPVVLLAAGGGGYFAFTRLHHKAAQKAAVVADVPAMITLPTILSNLDSDDGHPQFVKLNARLEIARTQDQASVEAMMPQILNIFQTYLHETRTEELSGGGLYRLREAMLQQIANTVAPIQVRDLYFTELLTQ